MHQWVIDNMPVTWCYSIVESSDLYCTTRFPVGCYVTKEGVRHDACYLSVGVLRFEGGFIMVLVASNTEKHFGCTKGRDDVKIEADYFALGCILV